MRIVFAGMVEFSRSALEHLLAIEAEVVGICTLKESRFNADHVDLSGISAAHGIPGFTRTISIRQNPCTGLRTKRLM